MKAVIYTQYGPPDVLSIENVDTPSPKSNELLVKVLASTVTSGVAGVRNGKHPDSVLFTVLLRLMFGITKPKIKILGYEFSGVIEAIGKDVTKYKVGEKVFGTTTGLKQGSYAEYLCVPEKWKQGVVSKMPSNLSFDQSAAVPIGAMTAYQILKKAVIKEKQKVLIYGASGSVGTFAVQIAKYFKAHVTSVTSTANIELVKSIGADSVIDYTREDFSDNNKYDIIFDAVGKIKTSIAKKLLTKNGRFITVNSMTDENDDYMGFIISLIEQGKIIPVIEKVFPIDEIIVAHRIVDSGRKKGNVVIRIGE